MGVCNSTLYHVFNDNKKEITFADSVILSLTMASDSIKQIVHLYLFMTQTDVSMTKYISLILSPYTINWLILIQEENYGPYLIKWS